MADLPEPITRGEDRQDALRQAADCLEEAIAGRIADGMDIPQASRPKRGRVLIPLSGSMAAKASLYLALRDAGISRTQLALRVGVDKKEVRRMLNPRHPTKLPRIEQALAALGRRLVVLLETEGGVEAEAHGGGAVPQPAVTATRYHLKLVIWRTS